VDGPALREVVDRLQITFAELHDAIAATHFGVGAALGPAATVRPLAAGAGAGQDRAAEQEQQAQTGA
jgi:hypothetical protein